MFNPEVLGNFDNNNLISSPKLNATDERSAQIVVFETLRELMARGYTAETYNAMPEHIWWICKAAAIERASLIAGVTLDALNAQDLESAVNLGGNFFEHGYQFIHDGTPPADLITFKRNDV